MLESRNYLGLSDINMQTLPKIGYIALLNKYPIAAGFLRRVEGNYAQIDGLTSSPGYGSLIRNKGIELIVNALIDEGKSLRLHGIIGFTSDGGILARAEGLGFHKVAQTIIALPL